MEINQQVVQAIYLRDVSTFASVMAKNTLFSFTTMGLYSVSSMWSQQQAMKWQEHLTKLFHERYFDSMTFLRQQNLPDDLTLKDPEDRIITDISRACSMISETMQSVLSTIFSSTYVMWRLYRNSHPSYSIVVILYAWLGIKVREFIAPGIRQGRLAGRISKISGEYRSAHKALLEHGEAIVASGGVSREGERVKEKYEKFVGVWWELVREDSRSSFAMSFQGMILMQTLMNVMQHFPFLQGDHPLRAPPGASDQEQFQANAAMLGSMRFTMSLVSDAMMRLGMLVRQPRMLMMVSGTCNRVAALLDATDPKNFVSGANAGTVMTVGDSSQISFEKVDVDTPKGLRLVSNLSFNVSAGGEDNLLICGENGVGKTSIFRTLATLWPAAGGTIAKPGADSIVILTQTPYLAPGLSLEAQLAYPKAVTAPRSAAEMVRLLEMVELDTKLVQQKSVDWESALAFGQKQKLACARIFYQKPVFAILDEATRGLGLRFERALYEHCAEAGVTVLTVAHNPTLLQFHRRILHVNKDSWTLAPVKEDVKQSLLRAQSAAIANTEHNESGEKAAAAAQAAETAAHEDSRSESYEKALESRIKALPKMTTWERLKIVFRIVMPKVALADRGVKLIALTSVLLVATTWASGSLLTQIPGQLQALAMQADRQGYVRLTAYSMGSSMLMTVMDQCSSAINSALAIHWASKLTEDVMERYVGDGAFYAISQLDKRVPDADTRITRELVDLCDKLANLLKGGGGMMYGGGTYLAAPQTSLSRCVNTPLSMAHEPLSNLCL